MNHKMLALLVIALLPFASSKSFLGANTAVQTNSIHMVIQGTLDELFGHGHGVDSGRLAKIKAALQPIYSVLPKNSYNRLDSPYMRYAIQRYFSQRHGWVVKGFEPHAIRSNQSDMQSATIMHNRVPGYVEEVLKTTLSKGGFALQDVVVAIASMERLIFDDGLKGVDSAYMLNRMTVNQPLRKWSSLMELLKSYFIVEHLDGNSTHIMQHQSDKAHIHEYYPHWPDTLMFIEDIVREDEYQRSSSTNPFKKNVIAYEDVARISQVISERFGPLSNHECHDMKMKLADMDTHGTGRVKLADFYKSSQGGAWQFLETSEYLTTSGALDTSSALQGPMVIIPNYITGANNCISSSLYYDICCLNECDGIYQHLEAHIQSPTASLSQITQAIEGGITMVPLLSSTAPVEPRNLSATLRARLEEVAKHHDDAIPLHGRLFAQWLHFAFPQECPYPHMSGTVTPETMAELKKANKPLSVTEEEIQQHVESDVGRRSSSPEAGTGMWSMEEELLGPTQKRRAWGSVLRTTVHVIMIVCFAALILRELKRLLETLQSSSKTGKNAADFCVQYDV